MPKQYDFSQKSRLLATIYSFDFCQKTSHIHCQSKVNIFPGNILTLQFFHSATKPTSTICNNTNYSWQVIELKINNLSNSSHNFNKLRIINVSPYCNSQCNRPHCYSWLITGINYLAIGRGQKCSSRVSTSHWLTLHVVNWHPTTHASCVIVFLCCAWGKIATIFWPFNLKIRCF